MRLIDTVQPLSWQAEYSSGKFEKGTDIIAKRRSAAFPCGLVRRKVVVVR